MSGSKVRDEHRAPKVHFVPVMQDAIDLGGRIKKLRAPAILKISLASGLNDRDIGIHHHVACAGELLDLRAAGIVIPVRVTDEKNFGVGEFEAELLDAC